MFLALIRDAPLDFRRPICSSGAYHADRERVRIAFPETERVLADATPTGRNSSNASGNANVQPIVVSNVEDLTVILIVRECLNSEFNANSNGNRYKRDLASWVGMTEWIPLNIAIGINPTLKPNRIRLDIPPRPRIIVPEVVVVQPALVIIVLPRKAQIEDEGAEPNWDPLRVGCFRTVPMSSASARAGRCP